MTVFVESVDVDAAWEVYYQLADRRHKPGLTLDELRQVIEAALVGVLDLDDLPTERVDAAVEAMKDRGRGSLLGGFAGVFANRAVVKSILAAFLSDRVEVEEHQ